MNRFPIRILVLVISLGLCLSAGRTVMGFLQRQGIIKEREKELLKVKQENASLEEQLRQIQGDAYVERIARDKLGMIKEGETIVIMPKDKVPMPKENEKNASVPTWKLWWGLFF